MAPLTIGLTGGIAAGKSEALAAFGRLGAATLSSDAVVHQLLIEPLRGRLAERWGADLVVDGEVDRARVGEIVFADPDQLAVEVHPLVRERTAAWLGSLPSGTEVAVVEVPLLFEAGSDGAFDTTVAVVTAEELRRRRAERRATPWSTSAKRASSPRPRRPDGPSTLSRTTAASRSWRGRCPP